MVRNTALALIGLALASPASPQRPAPTWKSLTLANTTITLAEPVPAGPFVQPGRAGGPPAAAPPRLRRTRGGAPRQPLMLPPTAGRRDADALVRLRHQVEVWLPSEGWNGKYQAVGNGGWAGIISYPAMATALREGYATSSTDTGHVGGTSAPLIGHPEKVIDYSHRAVHEMTVASKALINAFYERAPRLSYWNGCSTGGRQGLMSAQRFPEDFDAILAGAPANYHSHLHSNDLVNAVPALNTPAGCCPRQARDVEQGGAQRVRRERRRQGRPHHRAARVQVRPGHAGLQRRRRR
jgi:hypothetical protein